MEAGKLNTRIRIEHKTKVKNSVGQIKEDWALLYLTWAQIRSLSGLQTIRENVELSTVKASIRIRKHSKYMITAGMRVVVKESLYDIQAVISDPSNKTHIDLVCVTGANRG